MFANTQRGGMAFAMPDVCLTPPGPTPIPYPNFADQSSLDKGTKTVTAKGKMIAIKGSEYSRSNGDEAGTAGGVASSTNMKETSWISYSFDVKPLAPGKPPYFCVFEADFESEASLMSALGSKEGQAVSGDVSNFASGGVTMVHFEV